MCVDNKDVCFAVHGFAECHHLLWVSPVPGVFGPSALFLLNNRLWLTGWTGRNGSTILYLWGAWGGVQRAQACGSTKAAHAAHMHACMHASCCSAAAAGPLPP